MPFFNKILNNISHKNSFNISVILGLVIWLICFIILPIKTNTVNNNTLLFILLGYLTFILGFFSIKKIPLKDFNPTNSIYFFKIICLICFIGFTFRYLDLFYYRGLSFFNAYGRNKHHLNVNAEKIPLIMQIFGTFRVLFFLPILYLIIKKNKITHLWIIAVVIFLLRFPEIFLTGTRKPIFHFILLLIISFIYIKIKLSFKKTFLIIIMFFASGIFSFYIINNRMKDNSNDITAIMKSVYNDFVKIKDYKVIQFKENPNSINTKSQLLFIHTGQYIVHGLYEFDYVMNQDLQKAKGRYSFNSFYKLFHRLKIIDKSIPVESYHPRKIVYLTFFGSLYVDFGWWSLILFFIFGCFQKIICKLSENSIIAKILWLVLLTVNFSMPIFNLTAGSGIYLILFLSLLIFLPALKKSSI